MIKVKNLLLAAGFIISLTVGCTAESQFIDLPKPVTTGGRPVMDVLKNRHAERNFLLQKDISKQIVSNLLWATWGINRPDGKRTAPTAMNKQNIEVYVAKADGLWHYEAAQNRLVLIKSGDARRGKFKQAPILFYYAAVPDNFAYLHAGSLYQNAGLYCASAGLGNVVVGAQPTIDEINRDYDLGKGVKVLVVQAFGWPKSSKKIDPKTVPINPGRRSPDAY